MNKTSPFGAHGAVVKYVAGLIGLLAALVLVSMPAAAQVASDCDRCSQPAVVRTTTADDASVFLSTLAGHRAQLRVQGWVAGTCVHVFSKQTHEPVPLCTEEQEATSRTLMLTWTSQEVARLRRDVTIFSATSPAGDSSIWPAVWSSKLDLGNVAMVCTSDLTIAPQGCIEFFPTGVPMPKNP